MGGILFCTNDLTVKNSFVVIFVSLMKGIKRYITTCISVFLLLCFSVTVIPVDLFHHHPKASASCKNAKTHQTCNHKFHVSVKSNYCWICAIHYDKAFTTTSIVGKLVVLPVKTLLIESKVIVFYTKLIFSALRGPPAA